MLVSTQAIYMGRARSHQRYLMAAADEQLGQWPCTYVKAPGALRSPSKKDGERGMAVLLSITARGNYEHIKDCQVQTCFPSVPRDTPQILQHHSLTHFSNFHCNRWRKPAATQPPISFGICNTQVLKSSRGPNVLFILQTHITLPSLYETSCRHCKRKTIYE